MNRKISILICLLLSLSILFSSCELIGLGLSGSNGSQDTGFSNDGVKDASSENNSTGSVDGGNDRNPEDENDSTDNGDPVGDSGGDESAEPNGDGENQGEITGGDDAGAAPDDEIKLEIYSIEMLQRYGDSTIIKYGDYDILVDGGNTVDANNVKQALSEYVSDGVLELLIVTHPHEDHLGGISKISTFETIESIGMIIDTGDAYGTLRTDFINNVVNYYMTKGTEYIPITDVIGSDNEEIEIAPDCTLTFLKSDYYAKASSTSDKNATSIAFYVECGNTVLCMAGDATSSTEKSIMNLNPKFTESTDTVIYKASHHGSKESNSASFLEYLEPDYCFISSGLNVKNGEAPKLSQHPYYDAVARIAKYTEEIYWNGINGTLSIISTADGETQVSGKGRSIAYTYYNSQTSTTVTVSIDEEKDITYLLSKWYLTGVEDQGWKSYSAA